MGVARLLAKGWVAFCLFAGGFALTDPSVAIAPGPALVILLLFGAMGLLFIGGFRGRGGVGGQPVLAPL